jgi:Zn-dependent peptidase ImmA (M78 family)
MKPNIEISAFDFLIESFERIWKPGMEATKLYSDGSIRTLDDIPRAAVRAGCKISQIELPEKISGFAQVIEGQPYIVVNRAKPVMHSNFTIAHELGHHVLHSNPLRNADQANLLTDGETEFEANLFGATLIAAVTTQKEQDDMVRYNPEIRSALAVSIFGTLLTILMALAIWICSYLSRTRDLALTETT